MSFGAERIDFEIEEDRAVIAGIEDFDYTDHDFSFWRSDCYGNSYLSNDSYFEVRSEEAEVGEFPAIMKNHLAYLVNLSALEASQVHVPDFEAGVIVEDGSVMPYTVMEKVEGSPLSECEDILEDDRWNQRFRKMNDEGRSLSSRGRIIYPQERSNEDVIVDAEDERFVYINPGTFTDNAFYSQFSRSDAIPSNRTELGKWLSEEFWIQQTE